MVTTAVAVFEGPVLFDENEQDEFDVEFDEELDDELIDDEEDDDDYYEEDEPDEV